MSFMTESKTQIQFAMDTPMESTWTPEILWGSYDGNHTGVDMDYT